MEFPSSTLFVENRWQVPWNGHALVQRISFATKLNFQRFAAMVMAWNYLDFNTQFSQYAVVVMHT